MGKHGSESKNLLTERWDLGVIASSPEGLTSHLRSVTNAESDHHSGRAERDIVTLVLGVDITSFGGLSEARQPLGHAHRRIVMAFAELHWRAPGAVLTVSDLLEAGWPGERIIPMAGANRVYVALTQLRQMGMRHVIERANGGYRFAPNMTIELEWDRGPAGVGSSSDRP